MSIFSINKAWIGAGFAGLATKMITGFIFQGVPALGAILTTVGIGAETFENIVASGVTAVIVWAVPNK